MNDYEALDVFSKPWYFLGSYYPPLIQAFPINHQRLGFPLHRHDAKKSKKIINGIALVFIVFGLSQWLVAAFLQPTHLFDIATAFLIMIGVGIHYVYDCFLIVDELSDEAIIFERTSGKVRTCQHSIDFKDSNIKLIAQKIGFKKILYTVFLSSADNKVKMIILRSQEMKITELMKDFIKHYMDVAKPLPDVPALEPYRTFDAITLEHDQNNNRQPNYWQDKTVSIEEGLKPWH